MPLTVYVIPQNWQLSFAHYFAFEIVNISFFKKYNNFFLPPRGRLRPCRPLIGLLDPREGALAAHVRPDCAYARDHDD